MCVYVQTISARLLAAGLELSLGMGGMRSLLGLGVEGGLSLGRRRRCAFTFLISTLAALQRGICVSFMCGFSAGYDAVAIATLPTHNSPPHCDCLCLWLPILVVVPLCFGLSRRGVNCFLCQCLPRLIAVHSRLHKQVGVVNPIKQQSSCESRESRNPPLDR